MAAEVKKHTHVKTEDDIESIESREAIEQLKIKQLIKVLEAAKGNGTSMVSLILPPSDSIARVGKMLAEEYGTAGNIKSRVTRLSVLAAITSIQSRLKVYNNKLPANGLAMFCGEMQTEEGRTKKVTIEIEPFRPLNTSLYLCDNKFHCEALYSLLENTEKYGFIVMDGNGTLYGTLNDNTRTVLHKFTVDLPKKHGRGGQSSVRFARIRVEKRQNYVRKVAEMATQLFITNDKANVVGIILAGSAEFKLKLNQSDIFDPRLQAIVLKIVDVSYGGENGFNQAITLASDCLNDNKLTKEKKLMEKYFTEISKDSGLYCFGPSDTMSALEQGACSDLILFEELDMNRYEVQNKETKTVGQVLYLNSVHEKETKRFANFEVTKKESLLDWLVINFKQFGTKLHLVSNRSPEGAQFCKGFGGLGGILRYKVDFHATSINEHDENDDDVGATDDPRYEDGDDAGFI